MHVPAEREDLAVGPQLGRVEVHSGVVHAVVRRERHPPVTAGQPADVPVWVGLEDHRIVREEPLVQEVRARIAVVIPRDDLLQRSWAEPAQETGLGVVVMDRPVEGAQVLREAHAEPFLDREDLRFPVAVAGGEPRRLAEELGGPLDELRDQALHLGEHRRIGRTPVVDRGRRFAHPGLRVVRVAVALVEHDTGWQ